MTTASMNAVSVDGSGDEAVVHHIRRPVPRPQTGEVLLRVYAAAMPSQPGTSTVPDVAGRLLLKGREVSGWRQGSRLLAYGLARPAGEADYVEYATAPIASLQEIPPNVSYLAAASFGTPPLSAWLALFVDGQLRAGDRVVVVGAARPAGLAALQICRWQGVEAVAVSDGRQARRLTALGAARVVSHSAPDLAGRVANAFGGRGATLVVNVSGTAVGESVDFLDPGGRIVMTGGSGAQPFDVQQLVERRARVFGSGGPGDPSIRSRVLELLSRGRFVPVIDSIHPFSEFETAHRRAGEEPFGSVILVPDGLVV